MKYTEHPVNDHVAVVGADGLLIDVREPSEFEEGTLPGALNVPLGELPNRMAELDRARRVVLLCRSGNRSGTAAHQLVDAGFVDVVNLVGGMLAVEEPTPANRKESE